MPPDDFDAPPARLPRSERPSRTQLKNESHDLQALGVALLELSSAKLDALNLPEILRDALDDLRRITAHEGRRRQLQYVGKLMRKVDPEPLRDAVASQRLPGAKETLALHQAELWRDRLIAEDSALTQWLAEHPDTDAQTLRSLIRSARKDQATAAAAPEGAGATDRKGRSYRDLFKLVKAAQEAAGRAGHDDEESFDD
jgi:ribosome-associated protein